MSYSNPYHSHYYPGYPYYPQYQQEYPYHPPYYPYADQSVKGGEESSWKVADAPQTYERDPQYVQREFTYYNPYLQSETPAMPTLVPSDSTAAENSTVESQLPKEYGVLEYTYPNQQDQRPYIAPSPGPPIQGIVYTNQNIIPPYIEDRQESSADEEGTGMDEREWYSIERSHSKRVYVCVECSKRFTRSFNLKDHFKAIHLNIKPYACPYGSCDSRFVRKNDCIRHMRLIHKKVKNLK